MFGVVHITCGHAKNTSFYDIAFATTDFPVAARYIVEADSCPLVQMESALYCAFGHRTTYG
jgi:hypothetical protein